MGYKIACFFFKAAKISQKTIYITSPLMKYVLEYFMDGSSNRYMLNEKDILC